MALLIGAGTCGRALMSLTATRLYVRHGMAWPAVLCTVLASVTVVCMLALRSRPHA
jgi:hypothetical protein